MRRILYALGNCVQLTLSQEPEPEGVYEITTEERNNILAGNFNSHATFRPNIRRHKVLDDPNRWFEGKGKLPERWKNKSHPKRPSKAEFLADFRVKINATTAHLRQLLMENHKRTAEFRLADPGDDFDGEEFEEQLALEREQLDRLQFGDDDEVMGLLRATCTRYPGGLPSQDSYRSTRVARAVANAGCDFISMADSPHFEQVFEDCGGRPLSNGTWFRALDPFPGKPNSLYFPVDLTFMTGGVSGISIFDAEEYCATVYEEWGQEMHMVCPLSEEENFYMWWHHPNQPFNYPKSQGLWLGITRTYDAANGFGQWTCNHNYDQEFFKWQPSSFLKNPSDKTRPAPEKYSHTVYTNDDWRDSHGTGFLGKAHFYCELNCDYYDGPIYKVDERCVDKYCEDFCIEGICGCYGSNQVEGGIKKVPHVNGSCISPIQTYDVPCGEIGAVDRVLEETMDSNDTTNVRNHGCHCVRMSYETQQLVAYIGGKETLDEIDNLCKRYFDARRCVYLIGGACHGIRHPAGVSYELIVDHENGTFSCDLVTDPCLLDICLIDVEYTAKILAIMEAIDRGDFTALVGDEEKCPKCRSGRCVPATHCIGEAPNLHLARLGV